jgi:hypothetical protein
MDDLCCAVVIRRCPEQSFSIASLERHEPPHVSVGFLHEHVEADTLECLAVINGGIEVATLWMDEQGKLRDREVSALVRVTKKDKQVGPVADTLAGNLVLTGPTDQHGDTLLLPEDVAIDLCDVLNEGSAVAVNGTLHLLVTSLPAVLSK